ncbi:MAG: ThuA domain-containing protein [Phycisphaerae bacterium]
MKRIAFFLIAVVAAQAAMVRFCAAQPRRGGPSEEQVAKIKAAAPKRATAKPAKPRKMLVLSYQSHDSGRFAGEKALEIMAEQTGAFELEFVRDKAALAEAVVPEKLKQYDAVCVNNSTGGQGNAKNGKTLVENLRAYVAGGGGLVGIHAATDNKFGEVFGGFFSGHPWSENVGVKIDDPDHPLCKAFASEGFMVRDEIYQFTKIYTREKLRVLLSLDMTKTKDKGRREDKDNAVAWVQKLGEGRIFYCSLGHNPHIFWDAKLLRFYLDGIQFALGDIEADTTPSAKLAKQPKPAGVPEGKASP